jgi:hypothetical protein
VNRRRWLGAAATCFAVLAMAAALALSAGRGGRGSSLSRDGSGWLGARRYLEARGVPVVLIAEPLAGFVARQGERGTDPTPGGLVRPRGENRGAAVAPSGPGTLVLTFPWEGQAVDLKAAVDAHLRHGGDVVVAYSGEPEGAESELGFWFSAPPAKAPVNPWRWYEFVHREWDLRPAASGAAGAWPPVRVWAPRSLPQLAAPWRVLYRSPAGLPVIALCRRGGGRVVVLPADTLANGRLGTGGNADLLETLLRNLGRPWAFDEFHHGLATATAPTPAVGRAADLLTAQLAVLYVLAVVALGRRQGPAWTETPPVAGSAGSFLAGVGALHDRLGHHRDAARLLLRRARELDRGLVLPEDLDRRAELAGPDELVAIARQVARLRASGASRGAGEAS